MRAAFTPTVVDNHNPVSWAWDWLYPPPTSYIELATDRDLGYIDGFYLGEYDPSSDTYSRWATNGARLRFPQTAGRPSELCLHAGGAGWPNDLGLPTIEVWVGERMLGTFQLEREFMTHCFALGGPLAETIVVELRGPTFIPDALDLLAQQGPQVGQLRFLMLQLAWAEVRR